MPPILHLSDEQILSALIMAHKWVLGKLPIPNGTVPVYFPQSPFHARDGRLSTRNWATSQQRRQPGHVDLVHACSFRTGLFRMPDDP